MLLQNLLEHNTSVTFGDRHDLPIQIDESLAEKFCIANGKNILKKTKSINLASPRKKQAKANAKKNIVPKIKKMAL